MGSGRTPEGHEEVCSVTVIRLACCEIVSFVRAARNNRMSYLLLNFGDREPAMKGALKAATLQSKTYKEVSFDSHLVCCWRL